MEERMKEDEIEIDLLDLLHTLLRKWWVIGLCLIIGVCTSGIGTAFLITPQYEASSMIYILSKTTSVTSAIDLQLSKQLTVDFVTLAKSRPVIENVIGDLGLDLSYEDMTEIVTVENPTDTSMLKMIVTNSDPKLAAEIANAMADATSDRVAEVMVTDRPSTVEDAVVPEKPASPSMLKNMAIGGLLAMFFAMAVIILRRLMDDTIKTEEDVRKYLQLNTLAAIPLENRRKAKGRKSAA